MACRAIHARERTPNSLVDESSCSSAAQGGLSEARTVLAPSARAKTGALAPALAILSCVLFCLNGELLQALQLRTPVQEKHASPLMNLLLCHLGGLVFVPHFWNYDTTGSPPSVSTGLVSGACGGNGVLSYLSVRPRTAALMFALLLTGYNYAWLLSARLIPVAVTNASFQVSVAMVYAASVPLFGESLEAGRVLGVGLVLLGSMLAGGIFGGTDLVPPGGVAASEGSIGLSLSFVAALGVSLYQVLFRYLFGHLKHDVRFLAFFSAWIGIWHILVIAPLVWLVSAIGVEQLEFPSGPHAVIGTMISAAIASSVNILYLCIALWGSPMLLPCSSVLSVPLSVGLDSIFHGKTPKTAEFTGHVMVVVAVVLILNLHSQVGGNYLWRKGHGDNHLETAP